MTTFYLSQFNFIFRVMLLLIEFLYKQPNVLFSSKSWYHYYLISGFRRWVPNLEPSWKIEARITEPHERYDPINKYKTIQIVFYSIYIMTIFYLLQYNFIFRVMLLLIEFLNKQPNVLWEITCLMPEIYFEQNENRLDRAISYEI